MIGDYWVEYQMCRQFKLKYAELQAMPEDVVVFWEAFLQGEGQAAREAAQKVPHR